MRTWIGCGAWFVGVVQFFVVHLLVQQAWARPYSWAHNNVSDLGSVRCAVQPEPQARFVCSPEHALMNVSFISLGVLLVVGAALTGAELWRRGTPAVASRVLIAVAGAGFVLVGLAPADVAENWHVLGALLIMVGGNAGLVVAGSALTRSMPVALRWATVLLGMVALTAVVLFMSQEYLGLGMGGMERVAAFPLLVWTAAAGAVLIPRRGGPAEDPQRRDIPCPA